MMKYTYALLVFGVILGSSFVGTSHAEMSICGVLAKDYIDYYDHMSNTTKEETRIQDKIKMHISNTYFVQQQCHKQEELIHTELQKVGIDTDHKELDHLVDFSASKWALWDSQYGHVSSIDFIKQLHQTNTLCLTNEELKNTVCHLDRLS